MPMIRLIPGEHWEYYVTDIDQDEMVKVLPESCLDYRMVIMGTGQGAHVHLGPKRGEEKISGANSPACWQRLLTLAPPTNVWLA